MLQEKERQAWVAKTVLDVIVTVLAAIVMLIGVAGVVLPVLPGLMLVWLAALGYGLLVRWGIWGPWLFAAITLAGLAGTLADMWASGAGAKVVGGASLWSIAGGMLAGFIGLILGGPLGALIGLLAGMFLLEFWRNRNAMRGLKAMAGTALGYGASIIIKLTAGILMVGLWVIWVVTNR